MQNLPADKWRNAVLSQFAISAFAILLWCFIPESARWLCRKGKEEQAKKVMRSVYGKVESYDVDQQYRRMCEEINADKVMATLKGGGTYLDVFRGTNFVRPFCLPAGQRRCAHSLSADSSSRVFRGIGRSPSVFQSSGHTAPTSTVSRAFLTRLSARSPQSESSIPLQKVLCGTNTDNYSCVSIIMLFVAVPLIEKLGRRTLLLGASPVCIISLLIMGGVLRAPGSAAVGPVLVTFA